MSCLGGDTDSQRGEEGEPSRFSNGYNWIRSFSEKVRGRRSGEWEDTIGVIRRRRLQGECRGTLAVCADLGSNPPDSRPHSGLSVQ